MRGQQRGQTHTLKLLRYISAPQDVQDRGIQMLGVDENLALGEISGRGSDSDYIHGFPLNILLFPIFRALQMVAFFFLCHRS